MNVNLPASIRDTLAEIVRVSTLLNDPWWVIGSSAVALLGYEVDIADVDLLVSGRDARTLLRGWARPQRKEESNDRFRSVLGCHDRTPIPVEVMGDLEVRCEGAWMRVAFQSRLPISTSHGTVFVPDAPDQTQWLKRFGRPKDLARARIILGITSADE